MDLGITNIFIFYLRSWLTLSIEISQPSFDHTLTLAIYLTAPVWVNQYKRTQEFGSIYSSMFHDIFHVSKNLKDLVLLHPCQESHRSLLSFYTSISNRRLKMWYFGHFRALLWDVAADVFSLHSVCVRVQRINRFYVESSRTYAPQSFGPRQHSKSVVHTPVNTTGNGVCLMPFIVFCGRLWPFDPQNGSITGEPCHWARTPLAHAQSPAPARRPTGSVWYTQCTRKCKKPLQTARNTSQQAVCRKCRLP